MEWNAETLRSLTQAFSDKLSTENKRPAERFLKGAAKKPNYGICVLRLLTEAAVDTEVRECAATNFENHVRSWWSPSSEKPITDGEKEEIKSLIVPLICSATPRILIQLSKALAVIASHDPEKVWLWSILKSLLENSIKKNEDDDVNCILRVVISILTTNEDEFSRNPGQIDFEILLNTFGIVLRKIFPPPATLCLLIEAQRIFFRILGCLDLSFSKENGDYWMNKFKDHLTMKYLAPGSNHSNDLTLGEILGLAVFESTEHINIGEKLSKIYIKEFVESVHRLLIVALTSPGHEQVTLTAIKFLTIVSTSAHHELFASDEILQQITESIVNPNVMIIDEDENLYEMEGSKVDTRSRIACELLKGIAGNYKEKTTERVSKRIHSCLELFDQNPADNWKYKYCAIYVVVSFGMISTNLADVESFFMSYIVPELQGQDVNAFPMLKAGALQFFTVFRFMIPKSSAMDLLGDVVKLLGSDVNMVRSYAAICIGKLLLVKDNNGVQSQARYTSLDISLLFPDLMSKLFGALEKPDAHGNKYIMRCIMHVLQIADISSEEAASPCIAGLTKILKRMRHNVESPVFNHYLFEAVATLGERACKNNPLLLPTYEKCLESNLRWIIVKDVKELFPYVFQLFAQLVSIRSCLPPEKHPLWFCHISFTPYLWEISTCPPSLIRWFQSLLQHGITNLKHEVEIRGVFEMIKKLMSSPKSEEEGFKLLDVVTKYLAFDVLGKYIVEMWDSIYTRLQLSKSTRIGMHVIRFLSVLVVQHGTHTLEGLLDSKKRGISFKGFLEQFWVPTLKTITRYMEVKLSAVASTKVLCESVLLLDPAAEELWGKLLDGIITILSLPQPQEEEEEDKGVEDEQDFVGCPFLKCSGWKEDLLNEIQDPKYHSLVCLAMLTCQSRRRFQLVIARYLSPANLATLTQLCINYDLAIV